MRRTVSSALSVFGCAALLFAMAACSSGKKRPGAQTGAMSAPTVVVTTLKPKTVPIYGEYVGQTEAVNTVEIHSQVTGFLQSIDFKEGSIVKKGQLLFVIDPRPYQAVLQQDKASLAVEQAAVYDAEQDVARYTPLVKQHAISEQQLDTAIATEKEDEANVKDAQAKIAAAQLNVDYTRITTPITGQIGVAQARIGDLVESGTTLLDTVYSLSPMYVTFAVSESTYLEYVERGRPNRGHPPPIQLILSNGIVYPYSGTINMVAPAVNTATGTLTIRASFPNPNGLLKPGLFARVHFVASIEKNALTVPQSAVQQTLGVESVFVVGAGDKVEQRTITLGPTVDHLYVVTSGLMAGARVIVEGVLKVRPGMTVRTQSVPEQSEPTTLVTSGNEIGKPGSPQTNSNSATGTTGTQ